MITAKGGTFVKNWRGITLREYLKQRRDKADLMTYRAEKVREKNMRDGDDMEVEAEGRIDELDRIWNRFFEEGDR